MKLYFKPKNLNCYFQCNDWKKQFKSSVQYFHSIWSFLTWCHSTHLIEWYTHELLMSLRNLILLWNTCSQVYSLGPQHGFVPGTVVQATLFLIDPTCWWSCTLASLGKNYQYLQFQRVWSPKLITYPADNVLCNLSNIVISCDCRCWNCNAQQSWKSFQWLGMQLFYLKQPRHTKISENEKYLLIAAVNYPLFTIQEVLDCRQTTIKQFPYFSQFPTLESDTNAGHNYQT